MRIAIDFSPLARPFPDSVVRTVRPILAALERREDVTVVPIPPPSRGSLMRWRQFGLPSAARRERADVLHSFTSAFPLRSAVPVVQTVHEAPWRRGAEENAGAAHRLWVRLGKHRAAATCTPSAGVARDLAPHRSLHVVPWGVGSEFGTARSKRDDALPSMGVPDAPFVLALGATRPKKRLDLVLAGATLAGFPVVVTGAPTPYVTDLAREHPQLIATGRVDGDWIPALVRRAAVCCVLSTSEGFALPVLEALASGTPVVASQGSVQAETAEGLAFEVDPEDADAVATALRAALAVSDEERAAGVQLAAAHTWDHTAERLADVWRSVQ